MTISTRELKTWYRVKTWSMWIQERLEEEKIEKVGIGRLLFQTLLLKGEGRKWRSNWMDKWGQ